MTSGSCRLLFLNDKQRSRHVTSLLTFQLLDTWMFLNHDLSCATHVTPNHRLKVSPVVVPKPTAQQYAWISKIQITVSTLSHPLFRKRRLSTTQTELLPAAIKKATQAGTSVINPLTIFILTHSRKSSTPFPFDPSSLILFKSPIAFFAQRKCPSVNAKPAQYHAFVPRSAASLML